MTLFHIFAHNGCRKINKKLTIYIYDILPCLVYKTSQTSHITRGQRRLYKVEAIRWGITPALIHCYDLRDDMIAASCGSFDD